MPLRNMGLSSTASAREQYTQTATAKTIESRSGRHASDNSISASLQMHPDAQAAGKYLW